MAAVVVPAVVVASMAVAVATVLALAVVVAMAVAGTAVVAQEQRRAKVIVKDENKRKQKRQEMTQLKYKTSRTHQNVFQRTVGTTLPQGEADSIKQHHFIPTCTAPTLSPVPPASPPPHLRLASSPTRRKTLPESNSIQHTEQHSTDRSLTSR